MGRKKKSEIAEDELRKEKQRALGSDAKRGIVAVFLFACAILFLLSFIGQAGSFGRLVNEGVGLVVGWSKWLLLPLLPLIGYFIIRRHETSLADIIKYTGLGFAFFAFLGLSHLFLGDTTAELRTVALAREGGGFIGYIFSSLLSSLYLCRASSPRSMSPCFIGLSGRLDAFRNHRLMMNSPLKKPRLKQKSLL